jgi:hypothetical protein
MTCYTSPDRRFVHCQLRRSRWEALETGGPLTGTQKETQRTLARQFEDDLKMKPEEAKQARGGAGSLHKRALEDLHITKGGHLMAVDAQGGLDLNAVPPLASEASGLPRLLLTRTLVPG